MVIYTRGQATEKQLFELLQKCDLYFVPALSTRVNLREYSSKLFKNAENFEAWVGQLLIGVNSVYLNNLESKIGFISNICVLKEYQGGGVAKKLLIESVNFAKQAEFNQLDLEVSKNNLKANGFYTKNGFEIAAAKDEILKMSLKIM